MDFHFGSKWKLIKIECIGLIPDCGQRAMRGGTMVGWVAYIGGRAACSQVRISPTLVSAVLGPLLSDLCDFRD